MSKKYFKEYRSYFLFLLQWFSIAIAIGLIMGGAGSIFLNSLQWCTDYREAHPIIIWTLPLAGFGVGLVYHYFGEDVVKGNNQILDEYHKPEKVIPLKMGVLVLLGTLATHLFGGSAGREGTAVQIGVSISDQFSRLFKLNSIQRKILLLMGISAGFSAVFGTPLAGTIFALEVILIGKITSEALLPCLTTAIIANYSCGLLGGHHSLYPTITAPDMNLKYLLYTIIAAILFGLAARLFSFGSHFFSSMFKKYLSYAPFRPMVGGTIIALIVYTIGTTKYIGLGIPTIMNSFNEQMPPYDFLIKLVLTTFTLGAGFKGGEVTPLFYIGATLGSTLVWFIPLPIDLLAGVGFVAVFAGATNTPIACTLMGIELFGIASGQYIAIGCFIAYLFSGHTGIYSSQQIGLAKHAIFSHYKQQFLRDIN